MCVFSLLSVLERAIYFFVYTAVCDHDLIFRNFQAVHDLALGELTDRDDLICFFARKRQILGKKSLVLLIHRLRITRAYHIVYGDDRFSLQPHRNKVVKENSDIVLGMEKLLVGNDAAEIA